MCVQYRKCFQTNPRFSYWLMNLWGIDTWTDLYSRGLSLPARHVIRLSMSNPRKVNISAFVTSWSFIVAFVDTVVLHSGCSNINGALLGILRGENRHPCVDGSGRPRRVTQQTDAYISTIGGRHIVLEQGTACLPAAESLSSLQALASCGCNSPMT